jgi:hypothetical protein
MLIGQNLLRQDWVFTTNAVPFAATTHFWSYSYNDLVACLPKWPVFKNHQQGLECIEESADGFNSGHIVEGARGRDDRGARA